MNFNQSIGNRDRRYWLEGFMETDDAVLEGRKLGKKVRRIAGKIPLMFAVEQLENGMGFIGSVLVERVISKQVREFARGISSHSEDRTDTFKALRVLGESHGE